MLRQLKKDLKANADTPMGFLGFMLIGLFLGVGTDVLMGMFARSHDWFGFTTVIMLICVCLAGLFSSLAYRGEFWVAVSMGSTRRDFLFSFALRQLLWMTLGYLVILLVYWVERAAWAAIFSQASLTMEFAFLTQWWFVLMIPLMVLISLFIGVLHARIGSKTVWGWVIFSLACNFVPRMIHNDRIYGFLVSVPGFAWIGLAVAVVAAMAYTILRLNKTQIIR